VVTDRMLHMFHAKKAVGPKAAPGEVDGK
jgi:hypothetical protein